MLKAKLRNNCDYYSSLFCNTYPTKDHSKPGTYPRGLLGQVVSPSYSHTLSYYRQFRVANQPTSLDWGRNQSIKPQTKGRTCTVHENRADVIIEPEINMLTTPCLIFFFSFPIYLHCYSFPLHIIKQIVSTV